VLQERPPSGSKEADRNTELPDQPQLVDFEQYAEYKTLNEEHDCELFYYFLKTPRTHERLIL
jgi:hypothetical protein